jgi:hypothetical protein
VAPLLLAIWTVLIWIGRVRNIVAADGATVELLVPAVLVALGVATLVRRQVAPLLAVVTIVVWVVRVPLVLVHDHSAAFVVVHMVLAAVSIALAALTVRTRRPVRV